MTITITKSRLALAIAAFALLIPATAYATHTFSDVPDGRFYTDAVEWAFDNGITTGTSATTFEPDAGVTRGENVTFAKRYDDNIVQPALATLTASAATNATGVATNATGVATNATGAATNATGVATNATGVATNTADIDVLETNQVVGSARVQSNGTISDIYMVNGNTATVAHVAASGKYTITWPGISVNMNLRRGFAQVVGSTAGTANVESLGGNLIVYTFNAAGVATDKQFGVLIFDD